MFSDVDKDGQIGWTMDDNCAVLQRCYKSKDKRTVLEPVEGYNWYYALLVCYDGFDTDKFYDQQNEDLWICRKCQVLMIFMRWSLNTTRRVPS